MVKIPDTRVTVLNNNTTVNAESEVYSNLQFRFTCVQVIGVVACEFFVSNDGETFAKVADLAANSWTQFSGYYPYFKVRKSGGADTAATVLVARQLPSNYV
jgi:hypothetical protein